MFHVHQWEKASEFDRPPIAGNNIDLKASEEMMERLLHGTHVVVLRCKKCGDHKIVEG